MQFTNICIFFLLSIFAKIFSGESIQNIFLYFYKIFNATLRIFHARYPLLHAIRNSVVAKICPFYGFFYYDFRKLSSRAIFYYYVKTWLFEEC